MKIRFENLTISFANEIGTQSILCENYSLEIGKESGAGITSIIIPANSGKSTLALAAAGLLDPSNGKLMMDDKAISPGRAALISSVRAFRGLSLRDIFSALWKNSEDPAKEEKLKEIALFTGLEGYEDHIPSYKSPGYQIRLMIAAGLIAGADYFVVDDPFVLLTTETASEIAGLITSTAKKKPVLLITSGIRSSIEISDEFYLFDSNPLKLLYGGKIPADPHEKHQQINSILNQLLSLPNKQFVKYLL